MNSPGENPENDWFSDVPPEPGSYALHFALCAPLCAPLRAPVSVVVGRLGSFPFPAGDYLYLGSARGPGGLRARLRHHARLSSRPHWHLDWLRPHAQPLGGWYALGQTSLECAWSRALLRLPGASVPAPGFGAADCRAGCPAHLVAFASPADFSQAASGLAAAGCALYRLSLHNDEQAQK